jgi:hypothetical protein
VNVVGNQPFVQMPQLTGDQTGAPPPTNVSSPHSPLRAIDAVTKSGVPRPNGSAWPARRLVRTNCTGWHQAFCRFSPRPDADSNGCRVLSCLSLTNAAARRNARIQEVNGIRVGASLDCVLLSRRGDETAQGINSPDREIGAACLWSLNSGTRAQRNRHLSAVAQVPFCGPGVSLTGGNDLRDVREASLCTDLQRSVVAPKSDSVPRFVIATAWV